MKSVVFRSFSESISSRPLCATLAVVIAVVAAGCSEMGANDIQRYAIPRQSDDEEEAPAVAATAAAPAPPPAAGPAPPPATASADGAAASPAPAGAGGGAPAEPSGGVAADAADRVSAPEAKPEASAALGPIPEGLSPPARALRSAKNMQAIASALAAFKKQNGKLPDQGFPGLSWRVHLLPYLGHRELYDQFNTAEPWFSDTNKPLLEKIPPVFQSPERRDSLTNYQVLVGKRAIYPGPGAPAHTAYAENYITAVEVDDSLAVRWTEPKDFECDLSTENKIPPGLGSLRDGVFAITADTRMLWLPYGNFGLDLWRFLPYRGLNMEELSEDPARFAKPLNLLEYAAFEAEQQGVAAGPAPVGVSAASGPSGGIAVGSVNASDGLPASCWAAAAAAAQSADIDAAWRWARGAAACGLPIAIWEKEYQWAPALQRPSLGVRVAVGTPGQPAAPGPGAKDLRPAFLSLAGQFCDPLLAEVEKAATAAAVSAVSAVAPLGRIEGQPTPQDGLRASPLTFVIQAPTAIEAIADARTAGADVLVYFDPNVPGGNRGLEYEVEVYDLYRGRRLLKTDQVLVQSPSAPPERLAENLKGLGWELSDFFEDALTPQPWPVQMTPDLARKRVAALVGPTGKAMPLVTLTELRYYRQKGLIDEAELLQAAEALLGRQNAVFLLLGDELKQRRVARAWLPSDDPAEYVALANARREAARQQVE